MRWLSRPSTPRLKVPPSLRVVLLSLAWLLAMLPVVGHSQQVIFGPTQYLRTAGPPNQYTDTVSLPAGATAPFLLHIVNGNPNGTNRVSSAHVTRNGTEVVGPSEFSQNVAVIDRTVSLQATNTLAVRLTSAPGSFLTISVLATGVGPQPTGLTPNPLNLTAGTIGTLTATIAPSPTVAGSLAVSSSDPGVATVPASVAFAVGQTSIPVPVTAVATGTATITVTLNGASAASQVTVAPVPPTVSGFTPPAGKLGEAVTITGTNFVNVQAVTFNGVAAATFTVTGATALTATVPIGAATGPLSVTTAGGTAISTGHFVVLPTPDFQISARPVTLVIPASGQASYAVSLTGSGGFTNLATLAVTGLPAGMTAAFRNATLTTGQVTVLTLTTNGTTPAGTYSLTVTAVGPVDGVATVRSVPVAVDVQASGVTSLIGQVLDEDANPVKGVLVTLGTVQVTTDDGGNFLLLNPPVGADQLVFIDGGPASSPGRSLPIVPYKVTIVAGQANTLGFIPHLHFQKTTGLVDISNSAVQRIVTDPDIPGFQMTIPAGVTITGWDGQPNQQISVRRVPMDRAPLPPFPADRVAPVLYMDYFGKPGGGTPSAPIPITFPNDLDLPPGTQVELWYFDEAPDGSRPSQWAQYGTGTVTPDGRQVVPDLDPSTGQPFGQPRFCCGAVCLALVNGTFAAITGQVGGEPPSNEGNEGGEPVDVATGIFTLHKTDLTLPGRLPVVFTRQYRTKGTAAGPFGPGTSHTYHVLLLLQGNLRTLVLPRGNRALFPLQPDGSFRNATDPEFRGAVLTVTATGHALRFKDGTTWTFGSAIPSGVTGLSIAFLIAQADRNGNTMTITRSGPAQNATTITDAASRQINVTYDLLNRVTVMQDPIERTIRYAYDGVGRLATVTDMAGGVTRYTYDTAGNMLTITDPRGITFLTNEYDAGGRVTKQTQADGGLWQFAYTVTGSVVTQTTVTDPRGKQQTTRFNGQGYALERTDDQGQATQSLRDTAANQVRASTDPLGRTTTFEYDAAGNVTKIVDPALHETRFTYDAVFNRVKTITDALNQITAFTYDPANGNLLTVKDPLNHITTITYNAFGQPISVQGPIATEPPATFSYDTTGNLITTTDPVGNQTQRVYDAVSRLTRLTDPRGFATQFRYDPLNRVTEIADAAHGVTQFGYDGNGNLLSVADAKDQATTYTYETMDRLATRKDALNRTESYQYDPAGNLTQFTDRQTQPATFQYDALNRRTRADYADGSFTTFTYDAVGRLSRATDSTSGPIDFFYDNLDRLILEATPRGAVQYAYDALGRRTTMTVAGQAPVTYQYDAASRLTQVAQGALIVGLGYDAAGRRTSLTYPNGTSTTYSYDNASRLTSIVHNGPAGLIESLTYAYDAAGDRISLTRANGTASLLPAAVASASYDAANEQTQFGTATQTFDQNGNLTSDGTNTYTWDARNRLTAISGPGLSASFVYDALGRRVSKTINGVTTQFLYDGNDIVQEIGGSAVNANYVRSLNIDEPFVRQTAAGNEFYHVDALGSTLDLTNQTGTVQASYNYEAFGKMTMTGTTSNPFQYTGRENDGTGLYNYRARYYSPLQSRFLKEDRTGVTGETNLYTYAFNNPVVYIDPLGLRGQRGPTRPYQLPSDEPNREDNPANLFKNLNESAEILHPYELAKRNADKYYDVIREKNLYGQESNAVYDKNGNLVDVYPAGVPVLCDRCTIKRFPPESPPTPIFPPAKPIGNFLNPVVAPQIPLPGISAPARLGGRK